MIRRLSLVMISTIALAACSSWMGENSAPPLPGKRISVLSKEKSLSPETAAATTEILLPPPEPNDDWPQAGGYSNHAMHHMEVGEALREIWSSSIGSGSTKRARLLGQPIIADGKVFTMDSDTEIRAFDAAKGRELWSQDVALESEGDVYSGGGLAFEDGVLFAATGFAQVVAMDARTGKVKWRQSLSGPMRGAPTVRGGRVIVVTVDNQTHCLSQEDGTVQWSHQGISESASLLAGTSPAIDGNVVVVPYSSGEIFALRIENGTVLWSDQLTTTRRTDNVATLSDIRGRPVVDRGRVYAIGHADTLVAIDLRSGRRLWEREIGGIQSPWIAGDFLYLVNNSNEIVALEAKTGKIVWSTQLQVWKDPEDHTGRVVWTGPILASDRLLLASSHGKLLSVSPYTGDILGRVNISDGVTIPPAIAMGTLFVLTEDAELLAYR